MRLNLQLTDVSFISYTMVEDTGVKMGYLYMVSSQIDLITCILYIFRPFNYISQMEMCYILNSVHIQQEPFEKIKKFEQNTTVMLTYAIKCEAKCWQFVLHLENNNF